MDELPISFLDWLVDDGIDFHARGAGKTSSTLVTRRAWDLTRYEQVVRRDLSWLLNTRRTPYRVPGEERAEAGQGDLAFVRKSVFVYGVQDPSSITLTSEKERNSLKVAIAEAIRRFEPRLTNISVDFAPSAADEEGQSAFELRFKIFADLIVADLHMPIEFDTLLKIENRAHYVKG